MSLSRLAASPIFFRSLLGANSFLLGQALWHYRPSILRGDPQIRTLSTTYTLREPQLHEHSSSSQPPPPPPRAASQGNPTAAEPASQTANKPLQNQSGTSSATSSATSASPTSVSTSADGAHQSLPAGWEDDTNYNISSFNELPHRFFGHNQHIKINEEFKETLRQILWQFRAPIRYAFAYGSGVFGQKLSGPLSGDILSPHPNPPKAVEDWQKGGAKVIDFIFGVSHTQHWHSLNLTQHPEHYSALKWFPNSSALVSHMQDDWGAGLYYNPFITVNGVMIKYGVVNLDTLARDLSEWDTLYLAGRLQKPVKILRDDPRIRLANQVNLISALRTALLMLPEKFSERQLYERITGLSYLGDPRMHSLIASESPSKVANIVGAQLPGFRQLYVPLIDNLPNVDFNDSRTPKDFAWEKEDAIRHTGTNSKLDNVLGGDEGLSLAQDMDPVKRGNMVRRLPKAFRKKLYYRYKQKFGIRGSAFSDILEESQDDAPTGFNRRQGGEFERRIGGDADLPQEMAKCVRSTVAWPSTMQTIKGVFTSGMARSWQYVMEKRTKGKQKKEAAAVAASEHAEKKKSSSDAESNASKSE